MTQSPPKTVILGAGAIGCYLGAIWGNAGIPITLLGRQSLFALQKTGLSLSNGITLSPDDLTSTLTLAKDPAVLAHARLIVITVKSTAIPQAIADIQAHAAPDTPILCLLNGMKPVRDLRAAFPNRTVLAGMVPYNVVWTDPSTLKRSSVGDVTLEDAQITQTLATALSDAVEPIVLSTDIESVQHGKLLLNLNNPINALSGKTLFHQLCDRTYRRVYAATLAEAIDVIELAGIQHAQSGPLPARKIVKMLRMPNWIFNALVLPRQKLDPTAQTSMAQDLAAGKPTEIDTINGEVCHIAAQTGQTAPINARLVDLVKHAETGGKKTYSGKDLLNALGLNN